VLCHERNTLPQATLRARRHSVDPSVASNSDEILAGFRDSLRQRASLNHRPKRAVDVVSLLLRVRRNLDQRRRPRHAHWLARLVFVDEPTATLVVPTVVDLPAPRPTGEKRGTDGLQANMRGRVRTLTGFLGENYLPAPVVERRSEHRVVRVPDGIRLHSVEIGETPRLPVQELERLAFPESIRNDAVRLDPVEGNKERREVHPKLTAHRRTPPKSAPARTSAEEWTPCQSPQWRTRATRSSTGSATFPGHSVRGSRGTVGK